MSEMDKFEKHMRVETEVLHRSIPIAISMQALAYEDAIHSKFDALLDTQIPQQLPPVHLQTALVPPASGLFQNDLSSVVNFEHYRSLLPTFTASKNYITGPIAKFVEQLTFMHAILALREEYNSNRQSAPQNIDAQKKVELIARLMEFLDQFKAGGVANA